MAPPDVAFVYVGAQHLTYGCPEPHGEDRSSQPFQQWPLATCRANPRSPLTHSYAALSAKGWITVNARGPGLRLVQDALAAAGFADAAQAVANVGKRSGWSAYCAALVRKVQDAMEGADAIDKLRFLLYTSNLLEIDLRRIRQQDAGIRWLGK